MPRKRKLTNLGDRCRFCLAQNACMSELFAERLRPRLDNLEKCCGVEIQDKPNYPKSICYVCLYKLEMWSEFKSQFLQTNKTLLMHFKVVEPQLSDPDKSLQPTADDLFSDDNQKRPKIDDSKAEFTEITPTKKQVEPLETTPIKIQVEPLETTPIKKQVEPLETTEEVNIEHSAPVNSTLALAKSADEVSTDIAHQKDEDLGASSVTKTQQSDTGSHSTIRRSRNKKLEREASTKRWVERKNALIAATGEIPSESDSDNGSQLSPVQKARAKCNTEKMELDRKRKLEKALKNLETNMTEKYRINQQDIVQEERKTRSRRGNVEEPHNNETIKNSLPKSSDKKLLQKSPERPKVASEDVQKNVHELQTQPEVVKKTEKSADVESKKESTTIKEIEEKISNIKEPLKQPTDAEEPVKQNTDVTESDKQPKSIQNVKNIEEVENKSMDVDIQNENIDTQHEKIDDTILPQQVKSEVSIENTTYIVTMTLDLPNSSGTKSDISVKTNGINIDATSQDGEKIDLMNAVQLQRVNSGEVDRSIKNCALTATDIKKCLKIEVEGMEVEALQRVQLELANFISQDIHKLLSDNAVKNKNDTNQSRFKDTYESLGQQLKAIIEKVLRNNIEAEKLTNMMFSNHKRISPDFIKAAKNSHLFQPKVVLKRMNLGKLCKAYRINNLSVLEDAKRKRGLVGPLSRTLGKRKHTLPKKFNDFSLSLKPTEEELRNARMKLPASKPSVIKQDNTPKMTNFSMDFVNDMDLGIEPVMLIETSPSTKLPLKSNKPNTIVAANSPKVVNKSPSITVTKTSGNRPTNVTANCPTPLNKDASTPPVNKTPNVTTVNKIVTVVPASKSTPAAIKNKTPITVVTTVASKTPNKPGPLSAKTALTNSTPKRQRHICGICGKELFSKEEAEAHVKNHKVDTTSLNVSRTSSIPSTPTTPVQQPQQLLQQPPKPKPKLMRCKRCQAIVEAKHVKTHVCDSVKYNCTLCDCSFGAEHLLIAHIETHAQQRRRNSTGSKESPPKDKPKEKGQGENNVSKSAVEDLEEMLSSKDQQGYSCFVCDKVFVDEEQMKDHLQMHCEEVSDEGDEKGFQCAFCGEKFQSEESLETHVGNHLLEDGDEKINMMINLDMRRDKPKKLVYKCEQCPESFSSSLLLAMHKNAHEEEESATPALNDYDKNQLDHDNNVCTICDEIFDTAEELSEHLDIHNGNSHVCILCEKPFSSIRDLQEHVSTHL